MTFSLVDDFIRCRLNEIDSTSIGQLYSLRYLIVITSEEKKICVQRFNKTDKTGSIVKGGIEFKLIIDKSLCCRTNDPNRIYSNYFSAAPHHCDILT